MPQPGEDTRQGRGCVGCASASEGAPGTLVVESPARMWMESGELQALSALPALPSAPLGLVKPTARPTGKPSNPGALEKASGAGRTEFGSRMECPALQPQQRQARSFCRLGAVEASRTPGPPV